MRLGDTMVNTSPEGDAPAEEPGWAGPEAGWSQPQPAPPQQPAEWLQPPAPGMPAGPQPGLAQPGSPPQGWGDQGQPPAQPAKPSVLRIIITTLIIIAAVLLLVFGACFAVFAVALSTW